MVALCTSFHITAKLRARNSFAKFATVGGRQWAVGRTLHLYGAHPSDPPHSELKEVDITHSTECHTECHTEYQREHMHLRLQPAHC